MRHSNHTGFSLLELLLVISLIGILTGILAPSYKTFLQRTRREQAQLEMVNVSSALENYKNKHKTYQGMQLREKKFSYLLKVLSSQNSYTISATPLKQQANDYCGSLTLNELGSKTAKGKNCW